MRYVACTGKTINARTHAHVRAHTHTHKTNVMTLLRKIRDLWDENNEMALKQMGLGSVDWTAGLMVKSLRMRC